jgi:GTP-binding protein Era
VSGADPPALRTGFVALAGWTNVGKSTLLNRLVGDKLAAVAAVAQTTRHRITGARHLPGRAQIVFVDTPGLHRPRTRMNRAMVEAARGALRDVDLALLVADASRGFGQGDEAAVETLRGTGTRSALVLNKIDLLPRREALLPLMARAAEWGFTDVYPVSALDGEGCDELLEGVVALLPPGPPLFPDDFLTDQTERVLAAEWVREKLLERTRQELPHAAAVVVESWSDRDDGSVEIGATILVDRDSQRRIVIGSGGGLIKEIGTAARLEIERTLGRRVHLLLWVKTSADWRNDPRTLRMLGVE